MFVVRSHAHAERTTTSSPDRSLNVKPADELAHPLGRLQAEL
jgi:hypothetical protein